MKQKKNERVEQSKSYRSIKRILKNRKAKWFISDGKKSFDEVVGIDTATTNPMRWVLLHFTLMHKGNWLNINKSIVNVDKIPVNDLKKTIENYKNKQWVSMVDYKYPKGLKSGVSPPHTIFYKGNLNVFKKFQMQVTTEVITPGVILFMKNNFEKIIKEYTLVVNLATKNDKVLWDSNKHFNSGTIIIANKDIQELKLSKNDLALSVAPPGKTQTSKACDRLIASISNSILFLSLNEKINKNLTKEYLRLKKSIFRLSEQSLNKKTIKDYTIEISSYEDIKKQQSKERSR